ncbi:DUF7266 family protein [Natranaeroarchaeum sulfidigenes]|uniref:Putative pilin/flagellin n=1 Tax=Natranaeroarchaeum sulfidigenes TaxID=2784880 RepID=A0A897MYG4_9EURY|nr:hypothetical protein [Natranaeroarchaeum sulfidigenes]QSG03395.1 putative pilin/flagellin [Natranaeroarchaeum sulfidigenes]
MADRAVSAVVGKALEASIVIIYIGLLTTTLYAGVLPEHRTAAATEVADRTVADVSGDLQTAVPSSTATNRTEQQVDLPATIRGETYWIRVQNDTLVLEHPHSDVGERAPIVLPRSVTSVEGEWRSDEQTVITAERSDDTIEIRLETGER